ncbi:MAG TPA: hypothetical protein VJ698_10615 [Noviherbaspirillum sp.]|nr:hypothetical protein [Noviherbaspirillum sp.]
MALLLSLTAHIGVGCLIVTSGGGDGNTSNRGVLHMGTMVATVDLAGTNRPGPASHASAGRVTLSEEHGEVLADRRVVGLEQSRKGASPLSAIPEPPQPHYFHMRELTETPRVVQDIPGNFAVVIPEIPPQAAILRLLINEEGGIDRVVVEDSDFPEKVERRLVEAFSQLRFSPGKIGRIPVRSQLKIEVMLESPLQRVGSLQQGDLAGRRPSPQ